MITRKDVRGLIDAVFEQEALMIGGLVAVNDIRDDFVQKLVACLEAAHEKAVAGLASLGGQPCEERKHPNLNPHPAIEAFLGRVRRGA